VARKDRWKKSETRGVSTGSGWSAIWSCFLTQASPPAVSRVSNPPVVLSLEPLVISDTRRGNIVDAVSLETDDTIVSPVKIHCQTVRNNLRFPRVRVPEHHDYDLAFVLFKNERPASH
jgi:hypothetical protein